jgi:predicted MFS family arabinose efflux permease
MSLRDYSILVAAGAFATTFAQLRILAKLPVTFLLKDHFHLESEAVALFFFWATFAWNVKPIAGLLSDAFPLFGTRRRHYMMLGSAFAGVFWVLMGASASDYGRLFVFAIALNVATVFASTVMGGLMVEAGQAFAAPGRISSLRQVVQSVSQVIAPLLGGYLATVAFGWTTGIAAATVIALAIVTFLRLREPRVVPVAAADVPAGPGRGDYRLGGVTIGIVLGLAALGTFLFRREDTQGIGTSLFALVGMFLLILAIIYLPTRNAVLVRAQGQLAQIFRSRTLWIAGGMILLIYTVPGLYTVLTYRQTDVLHFTKPFIGAMESMEAGAGLASAAVYVLVCRRFNLRTLLIVGVGGNASATLLYLLYNHQTAPLVHIVTGFCVIMSELAVMDLAVRSTPRGCEALGFALMMSMRNFGIGLSDVLATTLVDRAHVQFNSLVLMNTGTTLVILLLLPLLPHALIGWREGHKTA